MKKVLMALCLALTLTYMFGVFAQAAVLLPGADELNESRGEYILPESEEISDADGQSNVPAESVPNESGPAEQAAPAEPVSAGDAEAQPAVMGLTAPQQNSGNIILCFDGVANYTVVPLLIGDTAYVPFRAFCMAAIAGAEITWEPETGTSRCVSNGLEIEAPFGQNYIIANGRVLFRGDPNISIDNRLYVPVRTIAAAIGAEVEWNEELPSINLRTTGIPIKPAEQFYNQTDLLWLARIINAESKYEPIIGKIAVGNVVLNRVANPTFPDSVYEVIFDCRYSVQFYPTTSPVIYNTPTEESIIAAKACLEGYTVSNSILYFMNPRLAVSNWISVNCNFVFEIGNHSFYA